MARLEELGQELLAQQRQRLSEMQQLAIELAVAIASHLTHTAIESGNYGVEHLVATVVNRLQPAEAVTVWLHPDDLTLLQDRMGHEKLQIASPAAVKLAADPNLSRGDCRAETSDLSIRSQLAQQLEDIRTELLSSVPEVEVERRRNVTPLKPFPDRRHIA